MAQMVARTTTATAAGYAVDSWGQAKKEGYDSILDQQLEEAAARIQAARRGQRATSTQPVADADSNAEEDVVARHHEHGWASTGSSAANGPGSLVWGARIDERLDRLERLVEVASTRCESAEEQVAAVLRRCSDQREELEELRFEFRRKPT